MPFVSVTPAGLPGCSISLSAEAAAALGCEPGSNVIARAGSAFTNAEITASDDGNHVSPELLETIGLPAIKKLNLRREGPGRLQIGPLIGIMVSRGKKHRVPPYSSQRNLLQNFISYSRTRNCLAYVFSPQSVDLINSTITGYFLDETSEGLIFWRKHTFPLPDAVYDRVLYRTVEKRKLTREVTAYLARQKGISYFNPKFLNKWETYCILSGNPLLAGHLPATLRLQDTEALVEFLENHQTVYLKPVHGSLGKGILRISRLPQGFGYQHRDGKKIVNGIWADPDQLATGLSRFTKGRLYIMQKGLDMIKYRDRVFDIRVLMQRDGQGIWVNSAIVARVAKEGSIFPNVAAGGEPKDMDGLWHDISGSDWSSSEICALTKKVSLEAARTLEDNLGTFGEIGLDIGVDSSGQVWIIEINSKPSRKVFPKERPDLKRKSIELSMDFAAYLAGFPAVRE